MDCYIVLTLLCLLVAQTSCGTVRRGRETRADNESMQMMKEEIQKTLKPMIDSGKLPDTTCISKNFTPLLGEGPNITARNLSSFGCHLLKMSNLTQKSVSTHLLSISQVAQDMALQSDSTLCLDCCSLPIFNDNQERHLHVKCLLQIMDQRITNATHDFSA